LNSGIVEAWMHQTCGNRIHLCNYVGLTDLQGDSSQNTHKFAPTPLQLSRLNGNKLFLIKDRTLLYLSAKGEETEGEEEEEEDEEEEATTRSDLR
jgi:hypothetical protein